MVVEENRDEQEQEKEYELCRLFVVALSQRNIQPNEFISAKAADHTIQLTIDRYTTAAWRSFTQFPKIS